MAFEHGLENTANIILKRTFSYLRLSRPDLIWAATGIGVAGHLQGTVEPGTVVG
jgi:hypothetical protein